MHPRFIQFIDRLSERPHQDRQLIAFSLALILTVALFTGRMILFPVSLTKPETSSQVASIGETFTLVTEDLAEQTAKITTRLQGLSNDFEKLKEGGQTASPASVPLAPNGSGPIAAPTDEWKASPEGYYYEYPSGAEQ